MKVIEWVMPLNVTYDVPMKPLPLMVSVSGLDPAVAEAGERLDIEGWGFITMTGVSMKLTMFDVPPPGDGLVTSTG